MCEIPSNVIEADRFSPMLDGVSIGGNDLLQLTLGVDRDSDKISYLSNDQNTSYRRMISMAIKTYKPTSPGKRNHVSIINPELSKGRPEKSLVRKLTNSGGRNNNGRITSRHIGGGHKRKYRVIDFKRNKIDVPAKVAAIEYDPNRSANIANSLAVICFLKILAR